jgi:hypothetical protein
MNDRWRALADDEDDPMLSAVNLVDVFLVLVVALLTAVVLQSPAGTGEAVRVRHAGEPGMELVLREQGREVRYQGTGAESAGEGVRAGVAYRLKDGSIVYVPEAGEASR